MIFRLFLSGLLLIAIIGFLGYLAYRAWADNLAKAEREKQQARARALREAQQALDSQPDMFRIFGPDGQVVRRMTVDEVADSIQNTAS